MTKITENGECGDCGEQLNPTTPKNPALDYYRKVCSNCGEINRISIIRQKVTNK